MAIMNQTPILLHVHNALLQSPTAMLAQVAPLVHLVELAIRV